MALVRTGQLAAELGVCVMTVHRWRRAGYIRPAAITPNGRMRWSLDEIRERVREYHRAGADEMPVGEIGFLPTWARTDEDGVLIEREISRRVQERVRAEREAMSKASRGRGRVAMR